MTRKIPAGNVWNITAWKEMKKVPEFYD